MTEPTEEMAGMPAKPPGLWPDVIVRGEAKRVGTVEVNVSGKVVLLATNEEDRSLAGGLWLGADVDIEVNVRIGRVGHRIEEGVVIGTAAASVVAATAAGEVALTRLQRANTRQRLALRVVGAAADKLSEALGSHLRNAHQGSIPRELEEAHWRLREAIGAAQGGEL